MANRLALAPKPPSLRPQQAIPILEELIRQAEEKLRPVRYDSPVRAEWAHTGEGALAAALGSDDPAINAFGVAQCGSYGAYDTDETLQRQGDAQLDSMLSVLRSAVSQLGWQLPSFSKLRPKYSLSIPGWMGLYGPCLRIF
jgi:hypothetical protein